MQSWRILTFMTFFVTLKFATAQFSFYHRPYGQPFVPKIEESSNPFFHYADFYHNETEEEVDQSMLGDLLNGIEPSSLEESISRLVSPGGFLRMMRSAGYPDFSAAMETYETGETSEDTCTVCKMLLGVMKPYSRVFRSGYMMGLFLRGVCIGARLNTVRVCDGIIDQYKSETTFILKNSDSSPQEICSVMFGDTCGPLENEKHNWTIAVPEDKPPLKYAASAETSGSGAPLNILHISDTHYDPEYAVGSNADCGEPLCCQNASGTPESPDKAAQRWGDYRSCDLPRETFENMLGNIADKHKVDFAYWTGDLPPHDLWKVTREHNAENFHETSKIIAQYLPGTTVYPTVGNHEAVPPNLFPLMDQEEKYSSKSRWLYEELADSWKVWLPESALESVRSWLAIDSNDPGDQLKWMVKELKEAEEEGEKVHLIGHIPPGLSDCIQMWSHNFHRIVNRFEDTITGQFYGHTHYDEFMVFYDGQESKRPMNIAYIAPSVTTYTDLNPAYRIYSVDGSNMRVTESTTYFMNLTEANESDNPRWRKEYDAVNEYKMKDGTPAEWNKLVDRMAKDEQLFDQFYGYFMRLSDVPRECKGKCKSRQLCRMKTDRSHDYSNCNDL